MSSPMDTQHSTEPQSGVGHESTTAQPAKDQATHTVVLPETGHRTQ